MENLLLFFISVIFFVFFSGRMFLFHFYLNICVYWTIYKSNNLASVKEENRQSTFSLAQDKITPLPRNKKTSLVQMTSSNRPTPMPPPRRANSHQRFVFLLQLFFRFFPLVFVAFCFCFCFILKLFLLILLFLFFP